MSKVCLYLHIHQPFRLKEFAIEELGHERNFFLEEADVNKQVFDKVAQKCYWPMLQMLEKLVHTVPGFRVSFSITGIWVEQARLYQPALLDVIRSIMKSGRAEILAETYYHSLASLYSPREFRQQVADIVAFASAMPAGKDIQSWA